MPKKKEKWSVVFNRQNRYPRTFDSKRDAEYFASQMASEGIDVSLVKDNPRGTRGNFERCVEAVSSRGGAYDPRAVCAVQERKEIGQRELTRRAVAGKRRAARGNPGYDVQMAGLPVAWFPTKARADRYARQLESAGNRGSVKVVKKNPADLAAEAYEKFHGQPPSEFVEVTERIHHHANLFSVGNLESLTIRTIDKTSEVKLSGFKGAILAANEQAFKELSRTGHSRAQLFVKGGDQSVNLEDFGIDPDKAHETETLGKAIDVDYETNKVHLGDEGGEAVYHHKFRRTREGDAEVKVRWARYPDVIYRVLDERLEFSGGSYELIAEGINL